MTAGGHPDLRRALPAACLLAVAACGTHGGATRADAPPPADAAAVIDAAVDAAPCPPLPAPPTTRLRPTPGELFYAQLGLGGLSIGEAAVLIGPDGTVVLIDVGNDSHDDDVAAALTELTAAAAVDHIVITHFHADHGDGLAGLLGRITLRGTIVHRGLTDLTDAANAATIAAVCAAGHGAPLCTSAAAPPCAPASWTGTYPATACPGLGGGLALGADAALTFVAADGVIAGERFADVVGPIRTSDSNGENARSVVALLRVGRFRMLLAGDLTGGGSDTDDVEGFYAPRLAAVGVDAGGVDVLHLGHHGRDTSSNATWADRLLPADGADRNAVMGISTAHLNSPHAAVLATIVGGGRLGAGRAWTTRVATGGATSPALVDARGGRVVVATLDRGAAYVVQAIDPAGAVIASQVFRSVGACAR
ncbi:MAG: MBL fold metallo-hydrolase [Myxococcales bacterium]|nr:MBL fold metallo-hydrolase [Myxococcales bacterium]